MNATKEICIELYKLSKWHKTDKYYLTSAHGNTSLWDWKAGETFEDAIPAYDIGYLLEKLSDVQKDGIRYFVKLNMTIDRAWRCILPGYGPGSLGHTPADAAAKLCINLIKDGILADGLLSSAKKL